MRNPGGPRGEPRGLCSGCRDLLTRWVGRENDQQGLPNPGLLVFACPSLPPSHGSVHILPGPLAEKGPPFKEKTALSSDNQDRLALPLFLSSSPSSLMFHSNSPRDRVLHSPILCGDLSASSSPRPLKASPPSCPWCLLALV